MAADDPTPSEPDDELLEGLRDLAGRFDPEPEQVKAGALAAYSWRTIDAELAMLTSDSRLTRAVPSHGDEPAGASRAADRRLTFEGGGLTVRLEVGAHRVLIGRLLPAGTPEVELCWKGGSTAVPVDASGAFRAVGVPPGPVRLRCHRSSPGPGVLTTDWVVL